MAGALINRDIDLPPALEIMIMAMCADYFRRAQIICSKNSTYNVIMECRFLNYRILEATVEIAGEYNAETFIKEIGEGTGYSKSGLWRLSESQYKKQKRAIKINIARRLCLL